MLEVLKCELFRIDLIKNFTWNGQNISNMLLVYIAGLIDSFWKCLRNHFDDHFLWITFSVIKNVLKSSLNGIRRFYRKLSDVLFYGVIADWHVKDASINGKFGVFVIKTYLACPKAVFYDFWNLCFY